jgi:hypothetical protein
MILKNTYIQFEKYNIGCICTQYIRLEKYGTLMGMNGDEWTLVNGCWWTKGSNGQNRMTNIGRNLTDVGRNWQMMTLTERWWIVTNGDGQWQMANNNGWQTTMNSDCNDDGDSAVMQSTSTSFVAMACKKKRFLKFYFVFF